MLENIHIDDNIGHKVKAWLDKHGKSLWVVLAVAIAIVLGYQFYHKQQVQQAVAASALFNEYRQAMLNAEKEPLVASFKKLQDDYPHSPYTSSIALLEASRAAFDQQYDEAQATLTWVREHGKSFAKPLAVLRLAQIKFEQKDYDGAIQVLDSEKWPVESPVGAYIAGVEELRGDIAVAQGDTTKAANHYQQALAAYQSQDFSNVLLEMKTETYH